jgi:hypothetical protein
MLLDPIFGLEDQWLVTRMIYGAQSDAFDYHMVSAECAVAGMPFLLRTRRRSPHEVVRAERGTV